MTFTLRLTDRQLKLLRHNLKKEGLEDVTLKRYIKGKNDANKRSKQLAEEEAREITKGQETSESCRVHQYTK